MSMILKDMQFSNRTKWRKNAPPRSKRNRAQLPRSRVAALQKSDTVNLSSTARMPLMALAPYAMDVRHTRGRRFPQPAHRYRNEYARDRDRVIHSRAFRRLEAKTQVFTKRHSDHFRNRLTHTLEVAQIARTAAGALDLNSDLAEALALVHDIGHPPFATPASASWTNGCANMASDSTTTCTLCVSWITSSSATWILPAST